MGYQVLALKYRPERFQDIIGQDHVSRTLLNAFSQDRIAHAYLFAGPRGIGKTTTARILAKALNCTQREDGTPCNECQNCKEISASRSMDVLEIDGASNRGIDEIRNLRELVKYSPINSKFKVFIIDEVHMLTKEAFNALLKTLEEPPPHVKFVFATTEPNKVLPTILSRCQRHDFHRLSLENIIGGIETVIEKEGVVIDIRTKRVIALMADGSMRDALSLLDQVIAFCGNEITFDDASTVLGIIPNSLYFDVSAAIREKDRKRLLEIMQNVYSQGFSLSEFVGGLTEHFLNLLIYQVESGDDLLELTKDMQMQYTEESQKWNSKDLLRSIDQLTDLESKLKIVQQPKIYTETIMFKLLEMDSSVAINDLLSKLMGGTTETDKKDSNTQKKLDLSFFDSTGKKQKSQTFVSGSVHDRVEIKQEKLDQTKKEEIKSEKDEKNLRLIEKIESQWEEIIEKVSENGTSLGTFLSLGTPSELKGKKLIISFPKKYQFQIDVLKKNTLKIENAIASETGQSVKVGFALEDKSEESRQKDIKKEDPITQRMIELFGGKVLE